MSDSTVLQQTAQTVRNYIRLNCPYATLLNHVEIKPGPEGIRLEGEVRSYYLRQVLLSFVMQAAPGVTIIDHVRAADAN